MDRVPVEWIAVTVELIGFLWSGSQLLWSGSGPCGADHSYSGVDRVTVEWIGSLWSGLGSCRVDQFLWSRSQLLWSGLGSCRVDQVPVEWIGSLWSGSQLLWS